MPARAHKLLKIKDTYHKVHHTIDNHVYIDLFDRQGVEAVTIDALVERLTKEFGYDVVLVDERGVNPPQQAGELT